MRRFTTTSLTLLAGLVLAPACGAVIGIDDDRVLAGSEGTTSSSTSSSSSSSSSSSGGTSGAVTPDAGPTREPVCNKDQCGKITVQGQCLAGGECRTTCDALCLNFPFECPPDHDCVIKCTGKFCNGMSCRGGHSCTFDCTDAECKETECNSETCRFICGNGNSCASEDDEPVCGSSVRTCDLTCIGPGSQACKKGIRCCEGATTTCPDPSICKR